MTAHVKNATLEHERAQSGSADTTLAELRKSVSEIADEIARVAERRAGDVKQAAQAGTSELRHTIRRQPAIAMGAATLAGAVLAVLLVPRFDRSQNGSRWSDWSPVTRADLYGMADSLQRSMTHSMNAIPMTAILERLAQGAAKVDGNVGVTSALEKIGAWLEARASAAKK